MSNGGNGFEVDPFRVRRATREQHLATSHNLRRVAVDSLRNREFAIASEAYWGVVAHVLQAIAERHDLDHSTNRHFRQIVDWLSDETSDYNLEYTFGRAYLLHRNFYRIVLAEHEVRENAQHAIDFADRVLEYAKD